MNIFQKQLVFPDGKTMAEKHNSGETLPLSSGKRVLPVSLPPPSKKITVAEFEKDQHGKP